MDNYLYTHDHAWVLPEGNRVRVGISEFAQSELGEIAFIELPEPGRFISRGEAVCSIDSLKSTSEIYAPVSGTVVEINRDLSEENSSSLINSDPLGRGWLFTIEMSEPQQIEELLSPAAYRHYVKTGQECQSL